MPSRPLSEPSVSTTSTRRPAPPAAGPRPEQAHAARALGDERAAVGEPRDRPRRVEPGGDGATFGPLGRGARRRRSRRARGGRAGRAAHPSSVPGDGPLPAGPPVPPLRRDVGADSPLYAQLCELVADSPDLLALAARSAEETPMVFLAAVHDELLRDPDDELAAYYPTVGGDGPGPGLARGPHRLLRRARGGSPPRSPRAARRPTRPRAAPGCCRRSRRSPAGGRSRRSRSARARG